MKNIILIGPMGCGKSFIGELLAKRLQRQFVDLDWQIEASSGMSVQQIFEHQGEAAFRLLEEKALQAALRESAQVIASGGGVVLSQHNHEQIAANCWTVYLQVSAAEAIKRCEHSIQRRPLLDHTDKQSRWQQIMHQRESKYTALADMTLDTESCSPVELVEKIAQACEQYNG